MINQLNDHPDHRLPGKQPHIVWLIVLSAFASMGAIIMTPALPEIMKYFSVSKGEAQLTVTLFLIGYGCGQLIYGPLANRFGRRYAYFIGIAIATLGTIVSILSSPTDSFTFLLIGRLFEALGSSAGLVVSFTIISDFYFETKARKMMSYLMLAFAIVPAFGVLFGGFLAQYFEWQACFYFLLVYGLCLLIPAYFLPETVVTKDPYATQLKPLFSNYGKIFKSLSLVRYAIIFGLSTSLTYIFSADGPFIGINVIGLTPSFYGLWGMLPSVGMLVGALFSAKISQKYSGNQLIVAGQIIELVSAIAMLLLFVMGIVTIGTLVGTMLIVLVGHALIASNCSSAALFYVSDKANGSAVLSFILMMIPVIMTLLLSGIDVHSATLMPVLFVVAIVFSLIVAVFQMVGSTSKSSG